MSNLDKANKARLDKALDKKYRFSHGVDTFRGMIERGLFSYYEEGQVPSVQWNRRKFNSMGHKQQEEYQKKLDTMKTEYRLYNKDCPHNSYCAVPKMVFDWFNKRTLNNVK